MSATGPWRCYRIVFAAEAPVHIGWHRLGTIERTRYFIPARAMWGAAVAAMGPRLHGSAGVPGMYRATEETFEDSLRFTCFFASDSVESLVWRPKYTEDGLFYGDLPAADFESRFVFSQTCAALNPATLTALDGALHESEFLWHGDPIRSARKSLHFTGYFLCRQTFPAGLEEGLSSIAVGADRNYGWGRMRLRDCKVVREPLFGEFELLPVDSEDPQVRAVSPGVHLPAHVDVQTGDAEMNRAIKGDVELLGGRDWGVAGSGRNLAKLALCWTPGSRVKNTGSAFKIRPLGIWR